MNVLGIHFVPLNVPFKCHLEALSAGILFLLVLGLLPIGIFGTIYVLLCTQYSTFLLTYLFWICVLDKDIPEQGSRINEWVRSWTLFKYARNYFSITVKAVPGFKVDPQRNYMSCSFPHGIMPLGVMTTFLTNACEETKILFPQHDIHGLTLRFNFWVPIYREVLLALGLCSASAKSITWLLQHPGGGKLVGIIVGGAAETFHAKEGQYRLVLKNRKGFVKLAIENGSPIIPTFAFGQNDIFKHLIFDDASVIRRLQNWIKRLTGVAPVLFCGRGLFQYNFGIIPLQKPINIVVGQPIEVTKIQCPSQEDIDAVHSTFIEKLTELFEKYKYEYEKKPEQSTLIIC